MNTAKTITMTVVYLNTGYACRCIHFSEGCVSYSNSSADVGEHTQRNTNDESDLGLRIAQSARAHLLTGECLHPQLQTHKSLLERGNLIEGPSLIEGSHCVPVSHRAAVGGTTSSAGLTRRYNW